MNISALITNYSLTSPHQLLDHYLRTLYDAKVLQIKTFASWADIHYSRSFRKFLTGQQKLALRQRDDLKALEEVFDVLLSGSISRPVRCLLEEANRMAQFPKSDLDLTEPLVVQLVQCVKHYESVICQSALVLARKIEEQAIVNTLAEIVIEDSRASLRLQNFLIDYQHNTNYTLNSDLEKS